MATLVLMFVLVAVSVAGLEWMAPWVILALAVTAVAGGEGPEGRRHRPGRPSAVLPVRIGASRAGG